MRYSWMQQRAVMPAFFMFGPASDLFTDFLLHLNEEIRILLHKEVSVMPKLIPELMRKRVTQITLEDLRALSVKGLLLDVDNTLASHGHPDPLDGVIEWLALMRKNGIALLLISNNREKRVRDFAARLRLPFVANACKPLPFRIRRAAKRMNLPVSAIAVVGDQVYTDVLGGHGAGMKAILVERVDEAESLSFRIRRRMEEKVVQKYQEQEKTENRRDDRDGTVRTGGKL